MRNILPLILLFLSFPAYAGDYLVTYAPGAERFQASASRTLSSNVDLVSTSNPDQLRAMPGVVAVEEDRLLYPSSTPVTNDPNYSWHLPAINLPSFGGGAGVKVAVLDSGYDVNHPDINYSATWNTLSDTSETWVNNPHGMGTSGMIGAIADNGVNTAGVAHGVGLMGVQVTEFDHGAAYLSEIVEGFQWAIDNGARLVSASFSNLASSPSIFNLAEDFRGQFDGQLVVSSGNSGNDISHHNSRAITSVGATNEAGERASFSTYGTQLDVMAPGVNVWSLKGDGAKLWNGTSFSAPTVAGVLGLILATNPGMDMDAAQQRLFDTAVDLNLPGYDVETGWGLVNVEAALGGGAAVPVPAAVWLFGSGLLGLVCVARRRC